QRRDRRLADPERPPERRERRVLGVLPSRRRSRHRELAACRPSHRGRRDARDARAPRARAHQRSRHRGRPPRRRRLSRGTRDGGAHGHQAADGRVVLSSRYRPYHIPMFLAKYAWLTARRMPVLVNFEVTLRCNARCGFCDYWKTDPGARAQELTSYADAARFFSPMLVTFTGGEPLLRKDLEELVSSVARAVRLQYVILLTHGGMLSVERARSLWDAGVDQFNISLDYVDG